ncbi:MAG: putative flap endonuclease-1-like 5' DNA nuclease [Polaribacter sp.]|jgi:predicted flap endonuclease-1-like 5' DNA nuclease
MATTILEKVNVQKAAQNIKTTASNLNKEVMNTSEDIVEGAIESGENWNKIFEKAAKKGTVLFGKQQDIILDTLEGVIGQYATGAQRFGKLIGLPTMYKKFDKATDEVTKTAKAKVKETREAIDGVMETAMNSDVVKMASEVIPTAKKAIAKKVTAKPATKKVKAKEVTVKATAKPATKKATAKSVVKADDLKVIDGVGPKLEKILNKGGINTYLQVSKAKVSTLKELLLTAGPRYKTYDPSTWGRQAELAAAQRMMELKKFQASLKS